jgi:hypothetical protein
MLKSRTRMAGNAECMGKINAYKFWLENLKGRDHLAEPGIYGSIILKQTLKK